MDSRDTDHTDRERYEKRDVELLHRDASYIVHDDEEFFNDGAEYDPYEDHRPDIVKQATRGWRVIGDLTTWP